MEIIMNAQVGVLAHVGDQVAEGAPWALPLMAAAAAVGAIVAFRKGRKGIGAGVSVVCLAALGLWATSSEWTWLVEDGSVQAKGVSAPTLELVDGQERFRVTEDSSASYSVVERLGGGESTAVGATTLLAGDIALDRETPANTEIGTIVVNVEAFESGSALRDKRIRHDFLESTAYPYAEFEPTDVSGLPDDVVEGEAYEISIEGDLTVKETTAPATFDGTVTLDGDTLTASLDSTILMSDYDVGPIYISGLVSTDDEIVLSLDLVAERTDDSAAAEITEFAATDVQIGEAPFSRTIQPIIEEACASCHIDGGPGHATVALDTAGDAAEIAADIALVTESRYMPPWLASDLSVEFDHDWSLSDEQRTELIAWAEGGGGLDVPADTPLVPSSERVRDLDGDVTLRGEAYVGSAAHKDDYRCQIFEFPESEDVRWLRGFQFVPDAEEVVHHAIFFHAGEGARADAEALDAADAAPGWQCFGLSGLRRSIEQIAGWAPGQQPHQYPDGIGIPVQPGDFLVVQVHYHYDHEFPFDASTVVADFASPEELAASGGTLRVLDNETYLAPAEVPCRPDESGPMCDRDLVLGDIRTRFGSFAGVIPDALLAGCGQTLEPYLADTDGVGNASCVHQIRNPGEVIGVLGHMHEFGETFRMTLNPGQPDERILLDIPNWSFEWQLVYRPTETLIVDRDDTLLIECSWDRRNAPMPEPRYITWNEGTNDEMCYSAFTTVPVETQATARR